MVNNARCRVARLMILPAVARRLFWAVVVLVMLPGNMSLTGAEADGQATTTWKLGTPIVSYWSGDMPLTDALAQQMVDGGFNLVWCWEKELDVAQRHGLRAQLKDKERDGLLSLESLDNPAKRKQIDALTTRVCKHPALYSYFIKDEPQAAQFPALGRLVGYLRQRDPAHLAYINLFPTYANNEQLGTKGDTVTAYREHLRQYIDVVKPSLLSYDHYQFETTGDSDQYFLNLALMREAAVQAGIPFLNTVQVSSWMPSVRVPTGDEVRYLVYTTLAYGAQGISYFVYYHPDCRGGIVRAEGTPTPLYDVLKSLNRQFVAIATELQPLRSLAVYHAGMMPPGAKPLANDSPFRLDPPVSPMPWKSRQPVKGMLLGFFGPSAKGDAGSPPTHVLVVNLDYKANGVTTLVGPGRLEVFDAATGTWSPTAADRAELRLPPGGGKLVRIAPRSDKPNQ
jgi:hypothetical protein